MSYSRWSDSVWYTYWSSIHSGDTKESQVFDICGEELCFTLSDIKKDVYACIRKIGETGNYTQDELWELRGYMLRFVEDVENNFEEIMEMKRERQTDQNKTQLEMAKLFSKVGDQVDRDMGKVWKENAVQAAERGGLKIIK